MKAKVYVMSTVKPFRFGVAFLDSGAVVGSRGPKVSWIGVRSSYPRHFYPAHMWRKGDKACFYAEDLQDIKDLAGKLGVGEHWTLDRLPLVAVSP